MTLNKANKWKWVERSQWLALWAKQMSVVPLLALTGFTEFYFQILSASFWQRRLSRILYRIVWFLVDNFSNSFLTFTTADFRVGVSKKKLISIYIFSMKRWWRSGVVNYRITVENWTHNLIWKTNSFIFDEFTLSIFNPGVRRESSYQNVNEQKLRK